MVLLSMDITMSRITSCYHTVEWDPSNENTLHVSIHSIMLYIFVLNCFVPDIILDVGLSLL